jgi:O-antigen ligase
MPAAILLMSAMFRVLILKQKAKLSRRGFAPLSLFFSYILISGLFLVSDQPPFLFKGQEPIDSLLRAILTLAVGLVFYLVACLQIRTAVDIRRTIRLLFFGMCASILLAAFQAFALAIGGSALRMAQVTTDLFAVHYQNLQGRAQGMAFEPSWLATQIVVLMVPALIAANVSKQECVSVARQKHHGLYLIFGYTVAIIGLLAAGSRFGLIAIVTMLITNSFLAARRGRVLGAIALLVVLSAGGAGLYVMSDLGTGAGSSYVLGPVIYLAGNNDLDVSRPDASAALTNTLALASRVAGMQAAASMWIDHPLFGVSFGNNFRFFGRYAPDWVFLTDAFTQGNREVVGWLDPYAPEKGTARNMMLRLLSESGLVGFVLFGVFLVGQIFRGPAHDSYHAYFRIGTAMALALAFFNLDTFVDPFLWIPVAICSAMSALPVQSASTIPPGAQTPFPVAS